MILAFPFSKYWATRNSDFSTISRVYVFLTGVAPRAVVETRFSVATRGGPMR